jgi:hypothetical protein
MAEMCKIGSEEPCDSGTKTGIVKLGAPEQDKYQKIKQDAISKILNGAVKCYKDGKCDESIDIKVITVNGCEVCKTHIPEIESMLRSIGESPIGAMIPIQIEEINYNHGGKDLFHSVGCEGTPCVIKNNKKLYDGKKGYVGSFATILGRKNPLYED